MNISYLRAPSIGDILYAEAKEIDKSNRVGNYNIEVKTKQDELIAVCHAMVYRKNDSLPFVK